VLTTSLALSLANGDESDNLVIDKPVDLWSFLFHAFAVQGFSCPCTPLAREEAHTPVMTKKNVAFNIVFLGLDQAFQSHAHFIECSKNDVKTRQ